MGFAAIAAGSSPLTRGKHIDRTCRQRQVGLIPAHAGKTQRRAQAMGPDRAHPRSRGENGYALVTESSGAGSSPLTRGKHARLSAFITGSGLIPAHAGKTRSTRAASRGRRAHPRSRGENLVQAWRFQRSEGSSPLTRGKPPPSAFAPYRVRLIPAHAGKTGSVTVVSASSAAHPRSRGENIVDKPNVLAGLGSSPLTRGKHAGRVHAGNLRRLIPAHAGKTTGKMAMCPDPTAHPRSRGENTN